MGGKGKKAKNVIKNNPGITGLKNYAEAAQDPSVQAALMEYSSGNASLQDVLSDLANQEVDTSSYDAKIADLQERAKRYQERLNSKNISFAEKSHFLKTLADTQKYIKDAQRAKQAAIQKAATSSRARTHQVFMDPTTGTLAATDQVRSNPLLEQQFGEGGLHERLFQEEQDLASRGYTLQPEDYEAYGQASDAVARLFAEEEGSLAQALASRGLAGAESGAALKGYSGLMGNKLERLSAAQRQIADDRMRMNFERLNAVRNQAMQSTGMAGAAIQDQFNRNLQGVQDFKGSLKDAVAAGQIEQGQENVGFEQQQATQGPGLGGIIGTVAGGALGSLAGGMGTSVGASLGGKLGKALGGE